MRFSASKPQPFEFLIDGELLRTSIEQFLLTKGITAETILTIEYIPVVLPPEPQQPRAHDEWVSAVALNEVTSSTITLKPLKRLKGHTSLVQSVAASPSGNEVCSGSWYIKLWTLRDEPEGEKDVGDKKRRLETGAVSSTEKQVDSRATLQGRTQVVGALDWSERDTIYSALWEHSLRTWDVETAVNIHTMVFFLLEAKYTYVLSPLRQQNWIRTVAPVTQLSSHTSWISTCWWQPKSTFHILTASYDYTVKFWDTRATIPLVTLTQPKIKVLRADWWKDDNIVSGGADSQLPIYSKRNLSF